jgi:exonuclease VII large subunit
MRTERYLVIAAVGLLLLSISSQQKTEVVEINEVNSSNIGEKVRLQGQIKNYQTVGEHSFFQLKENNSSVEVADFSKKRTFQNGEKVTVTGRITLYHGKLELIAGDISRTTQSGSQKLNPFNRKLQRITQGS